MKRFTSLLLCIALTLCFTSCTSGKPDDGSRVSENEAVTVSESTDTNTAESKSTVSDIGTRKNPAKIGDTVEYELNSFVYGHAVLDITLTEVIRGDEALQIIQNANMFNGTPEEGKEYVITKFKVANTKNLSDEDVPVSISDMQFAFSTSTFVKNSQFNMVTLDGKLSASLYEGASDEGYVVFISDLNDACYAVFQDDVWFLTA